MSVLVCENDITVPFPRQKSELYFQTHTPSPARLPQFYKECSERQACTQVTRNTHHTDRTRLGGIVLVMARGLVFERALEGGSEVLYPS